MSSSTREKSGSCTREKSGSTRGKFGTEGKIRSQVAELAGAGWSGPGGRGPGGGGRAGWVGAGGPGGGGPGGGGLVTVFTAGSFLQTLSHFSKSGQHIDHYYVLLGANHIKCFSYLRAS